MNSAKIKDHITPHEDIITPLFLQTIDNLIDGMFVLDADFRYLYMNKSAETFLVTKASNVLGKKIDEVYPDIFTTPTGKAIREAKETGKISQFEMHYSQAKKWLLITIFPMPSGLVIQVHDISIRKNNEHNLLFLAKASRILSSSLEYEETLKNLAKLAVPEIGDWCAVDMINEKGELEYLAVEHTNPQKIAIARELREKFPPHINTNSGVMNVMHTGKPQLYSEITDDLIKQTITNKEQLRLVKQIGFTSMIIVPICVKEKAIGTITLVTAETRRHYTKADVAMAEDLASRVAVAIENAKLYKEAQKAIEQRNEFISIASHELKTPVTSIKAYAQLLERRFLKLGDASAANHLQKMDQQLNRLSLLISDLLDVTRIESGKLQLNNDYYHFDNLIEETVESLQHSMHHKVTIKGATHEKVYGDKERTGQVLTNLLTNAEKYSPNAPEIIVRLEKKKRSVEACIQDFGVGIPEDEQKRVFERFYRVKGTKSEAFPGLGLGLYISHEIVKRLGGKIWVSSKVGSGSEFCFQLPISLEKSL